MTRSIKVKQHNPFIENRNSFGCENFLLYRKCWNFGLNLGEFIGEKKSYEVSIHVKNFKTSCNRY